MINPSAEPIAPMPAEQEYDRFKEGLKTAAKWTGAILLGVSAPPLGVAIVDGWVHELADMANEHIAAWGLTGTGLGIMGICLGTGEPSQKRTQTQQVVE